MIPASNDVSRRRVLRAAGVFSLVAGLPVAALAAPAAPADPVVPGQTRFRSVSVDTQPIADKGLPNYAIRISRMAQPIIASVFADRLAAGRSDAPRLVIRIDSIQLGSEPSGGPGMGFDMGGSVANDWISGGGEVVGARGQIFTRTQPIDASATSYGGPDIVYIENIRTQQLIMQLAQWVKRDV